MFFSFVPGIIGSANILVAIVIGAASGLSATGTNQVVKQLTDKSEKTFRLSIIRTKLKAKTR